MNWFVYVDIYCERLAPGLWDEPLNALSNAAFLIAAGLALSRNRAQPGADVPVLLLTALVAIIGLGSFTFHTFAQAWALLADVIPIGTFIFAYLGFALRRYFRSGWCGTLAGVAAFMAFMFGLDLIVPAHALHGGVGYLPAVAALLGLGAALRALAHPAALALIGAGALLSVSLTLRTLDLPLCAVWPAGTHFAWHILNAAVLFVLLRAAARHGRRA